MRTGVLVHSAFRSRCCPKGPAYQGSASQTQGACRDTQLPGHPSPTAADSRVGPPQTTGVERVEVQVGRARSRVGQAWLGTHAPSSPNRGVEVSPWYSLHCRENLTLSGVGQEHTAGLHMGLFIPEHGPGVLWVLQQAGREQRAGERT